MSYFIKYLKYNDNRVQLIVFTLFAITLCPQLQPSEASVIPINGEATKKIKKDLIVDAEDLAGFKAIGWGGTGTSHDYDLPSKFRENLKVLDEGITGSVWTVNAGTREAYTLDLSSLPMSCDDDAEFEEISSAKLKIKYFLHQAAALVYPCGEVIDNEHCYLETPDRIIWIEEEFSILTSDPGEVKIDMIVLNSGYIMFDRITVTIQYQCLPKPPTTETTTQETTTEGTTTISESPGTEETEDTWYPVPTTQPTTTQQTTTESTEPSQSTEAEVTESEGPVDTESPPTTEATTEANTSDTTTTEATSEATTPDTTTPEATTSDATTPEATTSDATTLEATTPTEATTSSEVTTTPRLPPVTNSPNTPPRTPPTPPTTRRSPPPTDDEGLTIKEILLYIALPVVAGLLLLAVIGTTLYCCLRKSPSDKLAKIRPKDQSRKDGLENRQQNSNAPSAPTRTTATAPSIPTILEPTAMGIQDNTSMLHPQQRIYTKPFARTEVGAPTSILKSGPSSIYSMPDTIVSTNPSRLGGRGVLYTGEYAQPDPVRTPVQLPRMRRKIE